LKLDQAERRGLDLTTIRSASVSDWNNLLPSLGYSAQHSEGQVVKGKVVNIEDYGAFLEIMPVLKV
jgi:ribosomal protein S1